MFTLDSLWLKSYIFLIDWFSMLYKLCIAKKVVVTFLNQAGNTCIFFLLILVALDIFYVEQHFTRPVFFLSWMRIFTFKWSVWLCLTGILKLCYPTCILKQLRIATLFCLSPCPRNWIRLSSPNSFRYQHQTIKYVF